MKVLNKLSISLIAVLLATTFAGCDLMSKDDTKTNNGDTTTPMSEEVSVLDTTELLREGAENLSKMESMSYDFTVKGDVKSAAEDDVTFDVSFSGESDSKDKEKPKFTLAIDGSGTGMGYTIASKAEIRLDDAVLYAKIAELKGLEDVEDMPQEMLDMFLGKWWKFDIPEGSMDEFSTYISEADEEEMTETEKEIKELMESTEFFSSATMISSSDDTDVYELVLDKENTINFALEAEKIDYKEYTGSEMTEEKVAELKMEIEKQFEDLTVKTLQASYNKEFKVISGIKASFDVIYEEEGTAALEISADFDNFNETVTIKAPSDATEFDPSIFMGAGM